MSETDARYPIGRFEWKGENSEADRQRYIQIIAETPAKFRAAAEALTAEQLDVPYRAAGWTARQVIHHVPDSHMNSFIRFKLA
ncbi:MAG TPA: DinB family protein, partial [Bryobacteraceae bacterium]|nr:DinB family protein [Bryobacteraceae bacterium]